ncbi:sulfotransferase family 2 domain-containing protein [Candidatus Neomarinimicrobiota bacterium]
MIISHKYKFIFIKPIKVAGTSVEVALAKHCGNEDIVTPITKYSKFSDEDEYFHSPINYEGYYNHIPPRKIKEKIGNKIWDNYIKFTIVRNPWDLIVSRYYWRRPIKRNLITHLYEIKESILNPKFYIAALKICAQYLMFYNFKYYINNSYEDLTNTRFYFDSKEKPICDFYIRYEYLEQDYEKVCKRIGIPYEKLPLTKTKHRKNKLNYSRFYNKDTQNLIHKLFKKDIDFFKYKFENNTK